MCKLSITGALFIIFFNMNLVAQCDCNCFWYIKKLKNSDNSPLFDSTIISSKEVQLGALGKSYLSIFVTHDSIDYLGVSLMQNFDLREEVTLHIGQTISFSFEDSTSFILKIGKDLLQKRSSNGSYSISEFNLALTDSLKNILKSKSINTVWFNNQKTQEKVKDRKYLCYSNSRRTFERLFCCFDEQKKIMLLNKK